MYFQTINMLISVENCAPLFGLFVGGNLHIFEILVFQIGFVGGYTALPKVFIK